MAMVLGAAAVLAGDAGLDGTVRVIFQPAEEPGRGARAMLDDGLLDRFPVDALFGLHNLPGVPVGHLHTRTGAIMASEDNFEIRITGRGGHAARPQMVVDPLVAGAEVVLALQTVVARNVDPALPAVLSCTDFRTDGVRNAIPGEVVITGDTRSFHPSVQVLLEERIRAISEGVCAAHGATCAVRYTHEFAPTVNDAGCTAAMVDAAVGALGADRVDGDCAAIMPSEDFGVFAQEVPSCFAFIGNGVEPGHGGTPLHSRDYDFNDEALLAGVDVYVRLVRSVLAG
jgi:hippurate hydrolase